MIKEIKAEKLKDALTLVNQVFSEFVAVDYSDQGKTTFSNYLKSKYDEVSSDIASGHKKIWGYYINDEIAGVIAKKGISHIALFFVNKKKQNQGIGKKLFNFFVDYIKQNTNAEIITVNSSPFAVRIYEKLGFNKTSEKQEKDGIIFIPMKYTIM